MVIMRPQLFPRPGKTNPMPGKSEMDLWMYVGLATAADSVSRVAKMRRNGVEGLAG